MTESRVPSTYASWTDALGDHFFSPSNADLPVTYFVDDDALAEICGASSAEAVASLCRAVRGQLTRDENENPFAFIERQCVQWERDGCRRFPPSLPLLAVAVLAATRMAASGHVAANDYYTRFWPLINLEKSPARYRGYGETVPALWTQLDRWLDKVHKGRRGRSTVAEHRWWTRIGYALSQALFRTSDRHKLYRFFNWIGLKPGSPIEPRELLAYYRYWVRDSNLSPGAKRMASDERQEEQLLRLLAGMAAAWDGTPRDATGRHEATAHAVLDFGEHPLGQLWIAVERPSGAPASTEIKDPSGVSHTLRGAQSGWYEQTFLPVTRIFLEGGWRASGDSLAIRGPDGPVYVLAEGDLGIPMTIPRATLLDEHFVVVRDDWRAAVDQHLRRYAAEGWQEYRPVGLPTGWSARRRVVFPVVPAVEVPRELRCLIPVAGSGDRPSFWGGLPLAGRATYLRGGEPDIIVPAGLSDLIPEVRIGALSFTVPRDGLRLRLSGLGLAAGSYDVLAGPTTLRFESLETIGAGRVAGCGSVVQLLPCPGDTMPAASRSVSISGAFLTDEAGCLPQRGAPLLLPRARTGYVLLGACPGEIASVDEPGAPPWMRMAGIFPRFFELRPPFPVAWILTCRASGAWEAMCRIEIRPGRTPLSDASPSDVTAWARALQRGCIVQAGHQQLWAAYAATAAQLVETDEPQPVS